MYPPRYMKATRFNEDGTVADVAHVLVTSYLRRDASLRDASYDWLVITVKPIGIESPQRGYASLVLSSLPLASCYFDLLLLHAGEGLAKFAALPSIGFVLPEKYQRRGIGSYILSDLIEWGISLRPHYRAEEMRLGSAHAVKNDDRDWRNNFYRLLGFDAYYESGSEERRGKCTAHSLAQLKPRRNEKKVVVTSIEEHLQTCLRERNRNENEEERLKIKNDNIVAHWDKDLTKCRWTCGIFGVISVFILVWWYFS